MILDILIFALGFLVAGLLSLAALPAVWRRAMRLSGERLSRLVPLSPEEVAADRDHLRATHAVELRRTEQRLERVAAERADLMAEASRREDRIAALEREGARADVRIAALTAETARFRHDLDDLQAQSGTAMMALHDASGLADKRWAEVVDLRLENQRLADQVDRDRASVAGLETRLLGATTRADDLARDLAAARERPLAAADATAAMTAPDAPIGDVTPAAAPALDEARRREIEHLTHEVDFAHEQAASAERRAAEAARDVERLTGERDALAADLAAFKAVDADSPRGDELGRLRAALGRLADDILKTTSATGRSTPDPV